jgi:hypothetical protein
MARPLRATAVRVLLAVAIGLAAAAGLAAFRGGVFGDQFRTSLWIVGCVMLLLSVCSFSPSTRQAPGELSNVLLGRRFRGNDDRGGPGLTVVLALAALGIFGVALLVA